MINVSVVMTTYNGEKYLDQQIQSLINQTLLPAEIIVCDDCSTDGTIAILRKYEQMGVLKYFINERRLGLIANYKKAVSLAKDNNCVALCDQDDIWLPQKLEKCMLQLAEMDLDRPCMVHTDLLLVDEADQELNPSFRNELGQDKYHHNLQSLLFGNFVTGCTIVMNPVLKQYFADMPEDIAFHDSWIALAAYSFGEVREVAEPQIRYRKHNSNLSIAANTKPRNRYRSTFNEMMTALAGKDDFLCDRLDVVGLFYMQYHDHFDEMTNKQYKSFLKLQNKPYLIKKLAFRRMVKQYLV